MQKQKGFTIIEIIVVIAIIAVLSGIVMVNVGNARAKARDARCKSEMKNIQKALVMYYADNGAFPSTGGAWWGVSANGGSKTVSGANAYIPGLTPTYMTSLPIDPSRNLTGWSGYLYQSNGINYKLLCHEIGPESFFSAGQPFYDPIRPTHAWMLCSGDVTACNTW